MSDALFQKSRRQALKALVAAAIAIPLSGLTRHVRAQGSEAQSTPKLSPDDPAAKALNYVHDASKVNRSPKASTPGEQQFCHNCQFLQAGQGEWRPCSIFGGKLVNANGWCSAWAKAA